MIERIRDCSIAVLAIALAIMFSGMAYGFFTLPTRQTIRCDGDGSGFQVGPNLDLDGDMVLALMRVCKERAEHAREPS